MNSYSRQTVHVTAERRINYRKYAIRSILSCFLPISQNSVATENGNLALTAGTLVVVPLAISATISTVQTSIRLRAGIRSITYLVGAVAIVQGTGSLFKRFGLNAPLVWQGTVGALGTSWTAIFLAQEGRSLSDASLPERLKQISRGALLGSAIFVAYIGVGLARGDLKLRLHESSKAPMVTVTQNVANAALTHALISWNEELVFRGYGYDVIRSAVGTNIAAAAMLALFGLYHEWRWQVFLGEVALGAALLALRIASQDVWMPIGYHWAWNFIQTGIAGPVDGPTVPLAIETTGPYWLVGRPGHPEPGALSAVLNLGVAALAFLLRQHRSI